MTKTIKCPDCKGTFNSMGDYFSHFKIHAVTFKALTTVKCRDCQQICSYCYEHGEEFPDCYKKPAAPQRRRMIHHEQSATDHQ